MVPNAATLPSISEPVCHIPIQEPNITYTVLIAKWEWQICCAGFVIMLCPWFSCATEHWSYTSKSFGLAMNQGAVSYIMLQAFDIALTVLLPNGICKYALLSVSSCDSRDANNFLLHLNSNLMSAIGAALPPNSKSAYHMLTQLPNIVYTDCIAKMVWQVCRAYPVVMRLKTDAEDTPMHMKVIEVWFFHTVDFIIQTWSQVSGIPWDFNIWEFQSPSVHHFQTLAHEANKKVGQLENCKLAYQWISSHIGH